MINKLKPKSEFSRNVLTLMTGTTIAQAIPIAISPILTRIYTPEDFGLFALYMGLATMIAVLATGRYELAIMLPKEDEDAINIVVLSLFLSFLLSFISLLIVFFFNIQITNFLENPNISNWLYFIPFTVFMTGVYQSFNYWNSRKKEFRRLATTKVIQSTTTAGTNLGMGFGGFGAGGLILSSIIGQAVATTFLGRKILKQDRALFGQASKEKMSSMMHQYIKFPKYDIPSAFLNSMGTNAFVVAFGKIFGASYLGFYSFAQRLLFVPSSLITSSLSDVAYQKLSQLYAEDKKEEMSQFITALVKKLFYFMTVPFLLIILTSKYYIPVLFGETWLELYKYFYVLSIIVYASLLIVPISHLLKIYSLQNISLKQHLFVISAKVVALIIALFFDYTFLETLFLITLFHTIALYVNTLKVFDVTQIEIPKIYHTSFILLLIYAGGIYFVI